MARKPKFEFGRNKKSYELTNEDYQIFKLGARNANYITDHYMRTPHSGTYWRNKAADDLSFDSERQTAWEIMRNKWAVDGMPDEFIFEAGTTSVKYAVQYDEAGEPIFFHNHGWLWQPWQLQIHHAPQPDVTVIGGYGCGKTAAIAMSLAVLAITVPNFRGFAVAPQMIQATEVYNYLNTALFGTPYWEKFVVGSPKRPMPQFVIENSYVGRSTIEIFSIEDDPEKIRTLEGDVAYLDQAEKFDDLEQIERDLGSRLRGTVRGRPRLGKMVWIANAGDNPQLWYRYDLGEYEPQFYMSLNPRSMDNPYLSKTDIANLKRRVGGTTEEIEQWMEGRRPMGSGEHFSRKMVEMCIDEPMNNLMEELDALPLDNIRREGFTWRKTQQLGTFLWEMPEDKKSKRDYIVISDPGSSNPPDRNSAIIMVFDVTSFPQQPMTMRAFNWIVGDGSYWPWVLAYQKYVTDYKAFGRNAFDSTGVQKGFDELIFHDMHLAAEGMNMAVGGKMLALNALKFFMGKGLIKFPYIPHLTNQLTNYKLPDNKIRQDLVMCLAMAAAWARRLYYVELDNEEQFNDGQAVPGEIERYSRRGADRYDRPSSVYRQISAASEANVQRRDTPIPDNNQT